MSCESLFEWLQSCFWTGLHLNQTDVLTEQTYGVASLPTCFFKFRNHQTPPRDVACVPARVPFDFGGKRLQ
jgi:hypothetical protein